MSGQCWVDGDPSSPICIVGDGPTREDMENGRPFSSRTGHLLWSVLKWVGITRDQCYILTVIGEWPEKTNGKPSAAQLVKWRPAFQANLARFTGRIIVPLGPDALTEVTGLTGIDEWRGYIVASGECLPYMVSTTKLGVYKSNGKSKAGVVHAKGDARTIKVRELQAPPLPTSVQSILPTLHPAVVLRLGRKPLPAFKADLERVSRVLAGNLHPRLAYTEYKERVPDIDPAEFVIDVETVPYLRVGLAGRDRVSGEPVAWTCPLNRDVRDRLRQRFDQGDGTFVAHNAQFDLAELRRNGFDWTGRIFDTMLAAYMLQPDLYKGLNEVASLYLDRGRWKHKADDDPVAYNLDDAKTEFELYEILKKDLAREGMLPLFESTMMPALRVLSAMTHRGIRVDGPRRDKWLDELTVENNGLLDKWASLVGDVNPGSPAQLQKLLFGRLKFNPKLAKNGKITTGKAELYELLAECAPLDTRRPILETLLSFRVNSKLLGTYARRPIDDDGCVHPYYLPVSKDSDNEDAGKKGAAGTGRIQARDPNIQQLPQSARRIIVPRADGLVMASIDFKQLELRIAATLSNDAALLDVLKAEDPFAEIQQTLGCDRTRAKNVAYGCVPRTAKALTRYGWQGPGNLVIGQEIMAFNGKTNTLEWQVVEDIAEYDAAPVVRLQHSTGTWLMDSTANHRWWGYKRFDHGSSGRYFSQPFEFTTQEIGPEHCIMLGGAAYLDGVGAGASIRHKFETDWISTVLAMSPTERAAFLNGVIVSDGHMRKKSAAITQKRGPHFEAMLLASVLHGFNTRVWNHANDGVQVIGLRTKPHVTGARLVRHELGVMPVWCPKVASGFWLMRQGDNIGITGNTIYGGGAPAIQKALKSRGVFVTQTETQRLQNAFAARFPTLWNWRRKVVNEVSTTYRLTNPFHRKRYFWQGNRDGPAAIDFMCQSTAADIIWASLKPLEDEALARGGAQLATIHDEALFELPRVGLGESIQALRAIMEREWPEIGPGFSVPTEAKVGENWGEMEAWVGEQQAVA